MGPMYGHNGESLAAINPKHFRSVRVLPGVDQLRRVLEALGRPGNSRHTWATYNPECVDEGSWAVHVHYGIQAIPCGPSNYRLSCVWPKDQRIWSVECPSTLLLCLIGSHHVFCTNNPHLPILLDLNQVSHHSLMWCPLCTKNISM